MTDLLKDEVDWRERALKAEAELDETKGANFLNKNALRLCKEKVDRAAGLISGLLYQKAGRYVPGITNDCLEWLSAQGVDLTELRAALAAKGKPHG